MVAKKFILAAILIMLVVAFAGYTGTSGTTNTTGIPGTDSTGKSPGRTAPLTALLPVRPRTEHLLLAGAWE